MKRTLLTCGLVISAATSQAAEAPQSLSEMGCINCHELNARVVGPSWTEVAKRYRDKSNDPATLELLVKNVSRGSRDNWGSLPMVASDPTGKKHDQIVAAVQYILAVPDQPAAAVAPAKAGQTK
jgi:cytochrome c